MPHGMCIKAVGNLYGFPPASQNFSIEFDKRMKEMGYKNTPWDMEPFVIGLPMVWIKGCSHQNFNGHKYTVTDCTDKNFVGINCHDIGITLTA